MLRATVARSKAALQAEPYETDDLCTPADIVRWTTIPDEYDIEPRKTLVVLPWLKTGGLRTCAADRYEAETWLDKQIGEDD